MPVQLEIDFVSDVACPWCAIGLASLEEALRRTSATVAATIRFQPFELNPGMAGSGENIDEFIGGRYGADPGQLAAMRANVRTRAATVGFAFEQNSNSRIYNTFDAHRLLYWARGKDRQHALKRALFKANFTDNADVSDHWISRGIHAVPAVIINGKWLLSGGQSPEAFENALRRIAEPGP